MKIFLLASLFFGFSALSATKYPVRNYEYLSENDYRIEVEGSEKTVVMVFSSNSCLQSSLPSRTCFLFEKKFDYYVPTFKKDIKVVGFNTYFENYWLTAKYTIKQRPAVLILKKGQLRYHLTPDNFTGNWEERFLEKAVKTIQSFH